MTDDEPRGQKDVHQDGTAADRLNSWKDIASYLGKGVRTVQRWESQLGLPVRRLGREGGESVFALRSEIDAWLLKGGPSREAEALVPPEPAAEPDAAAFVLTPTPTAEAKPQPMDPPPPVTASSWFLTSRGLWSVLILTGLAGVAMSVAPGALKAVGAGGASNPVGAVFEAGVLRVWDTAGESLWQLPLVALPDTRLDTRVQVDAGASQRRIAVQDLDGDGSNEVLMIAGSPSGSADKLYVFNADGSPRFTHIPGRPVTYGSEVFRGFNANGIYLLPERGGGVSLWLTASNVPWFPSVLQEISPRGEVLSEYWGNGHLITLRPVTLRGRPYLLLGGYNNEHHGASLAILDRNHATGTAPAENPQYRCMDCAAGEPAEFLVFPPSDIMKEATAGQGSAVVSDARLIGQDDLVLTVHQMSTRVPGQSDALDASLNYTLSAKDLSLRRLVFLWGYQAIHKSFERAGRLDHAAGPEEEAELARVLRWSRGRFGGLAESAGDTAFARARGEVESRAGS